MGLLWEGAWDGCRRTWDVLWGAWVALGRRGTTGRVLDTEELVFGGWGALGLLWEDF